MMIAETTYLRYVGSKVSYVVNAIVIGFELQKEFDLLRCLRDTTGSWFAFYCMDTQRAGDQCKKDGDKYFFSIRKLLKLILKMF